jgi:transposase
MDTNGERRRNKRWPESLKREIVAATLQPGASVSAVARQYDVNANQVFSWRRRFCDAGEPAPSTPRLVPVTITSEPDGEAALSAPMAGAATSDVIEIEVAGIYRIRVGARFDPGSLGRVLDVLHRAGGAHEGRVSSARARTR